MGLPEVSKVISLEKLSLIKAEHGKLFKKKSHTHVIHRVFHSTPPDSHTEWGSVDPYTHLRFDIDIAQDLANRQK